jgi:hypothetical protein
VSAWSSCYNTLWNHGVNPLYRRTKQILYGDTLLSKEEVERAASPLTDEEDLEEGLYVGSTTETDSYLKSTQSSSYF